jgi:hypothetical protein
MSRALFCVLPRADALVKIGRDLHGAGITSHSISTLRFDPPGETGHAAPPGIQATGQLKWAIQGSTSTGATRRIARALMGMGMPEVAARHYQELVRTGNTLLCVFCETLSQAKEAIAVLRRAGVRELASTGAREQIDEMASVSNFKERRR